MAENIGEINGVVYVDQTEGLNRLMRNTKLYVKLLNKFKVDFASKLDTLFNALEAGNNEEARVLAHTLKGTAANLSLTELYKQSLELESQINNKAVNPESLKSIKTCFDTTFTAIDMVVIQYD